MATILTTQLPTDTFNGTNNRTLGMRWQAAVSGTVTGLRFYATATPPATVIGELWDPSGPTQLASAEFLTITPEAWNEVAVNVPVNAFHEYVVGYWAEGGLKPITGNGLDGGITNGDLTALDDGGVFVNTNTPGVFLSSGAGDSLFFADIQFEPDTAPEPAPLEAGAGWGVHV